MDWRAHTPAGVRAAGWCGDGGVGCAVGAGPRDGVPDTGAQRARKGVHFFPKTAWFSWAEQGGVRVAQDGVQEESCDGGLERCDTLVECARAE